MKTKYIFPSILLCLSFSLVGCQDSFKEMEPYLIEKTGTIVMADYSFFFKTEDRIYHIPDNCEIIDIDGNVEYYLHLIDGETAVGTILYTNEDLTYIPIPKDYPYDYMDVVRLVVEVR